MLSYFLMALVDHEQLTYLLIYFLFGEFLGLFARQNLDEACVEPGQSAEVVDDLLRAVVLVVKYTLGVAVAEEDGLDPVDDGNVLRVDNEVEDGVARRSLPLCEVTRIRPGSVYLDWMARSDLEATLKLAEVDFAFHGAPLDDAPDLGRAVRGGDLVALGQASDLPRTAVGHQDHALACKAATSVVAAAMVLIVVHLLGELLSAQDHRTFLCKSKRRLGRLHRVVDVIGKVRDVVEDRSAEVLEALVSEVAFALHL